MNSSTLLVEIGRIFQWSEKLLFLCRTVLFVHQLAEKLHDLINSYTMLDEYFHLLQTAIHFLLIKIVKHRF